MWALDDINLEINKGEIWGVLGKNGAGKSTLLKILSRVTTPTKGSVTIHGRLASLLEVGTGFHPEMTGRENIFMNGVILGMSRKEVEAQFDEIVHFSGVEKYIDTPVKRYSSGMYVRLGFAVAAHLNPDILIVDEVLAVGDAEFQKRAIGRMKDVSTQDGRTVLFVSHNLASVRSLCNHGVLLNSGKIEIQGGIHDVISKYVDAGIDGEKKVRQIGEDVGGVWLEQIALKNETGAYWDEQNQLSLELTGAILEQKENLRINVVVSSSDDTPLFTISSKEGGVCFDEKGKFQLRCLFPKGFFNVGSFTCNAYVLCGEKQVLKVYQRVIGFEIIHEKRTIGSWDGVEPGAIRPKFRWDLTQGK